MSETVQLSQGQRTPLAPLGLDAVFTVTLTLASGVELDAACFGLDTARRLSDERYMTFFNQPTSPCGAVRQTAPHTFQFDLARLPSSIDALVLTLATEAADGLKKLGASQAVWTDANSTSRARFDFDGKLFPIERAVMLIEMYRKDGQWRVSPVAQGFQGGLAALVQHFGGAVADTPAPPSAAPVSAPAPAPAPAPVPAPPPPTAAPSVVSLSKITLEKRGDKVSLAKKGSAGHGRIVCNLRWRSGGDNAPKPTGLRSLFGKGKSGGVDLDLGCLFEMADGAKSVVQALGGLFGAYDQRPYIQLAGDDRTGQSVEGEFLYINGDRLKEIRRVCVYAFIYEGVPNWAQADGFVTLTVPGHPPVEVRMDGTDNRGSLCAIAMIENDGGELKVTKLAEYFSGQQELDARYGWGMQWQRGSKS